MHPTHYEFTACSLLWSKGEGLSGSVFTTQSLPLIAQSQVSAELWRHKLDTDQPRPRKVRCLYFQQGLTKELNSTFTGTFGTGW